jgi:uncharacterized protein (DUF2141 family)
LLQHLTAGLTITGYKYALSTSTDGGSTYGSYGAYVLSSWSSGTSFTISGLTNGYKYKVKIRAVNSLGDGAESSEIGPYTPYTTPTATTDAGSDSTSAATTPTTTDPTGLQTTSGTLTTVGPYNTSSSWSNPAASGALAGTGTLNGTNATHFVYGTTSGSYSNEVAASSNSYTKTDWARGTTIYYKAKNINSSCNLTLNGTVSANGQAQTVEFIYGTSSGSYPNTIAPTLNASISATSNNVSVTKQITGLSAGTYYYKVRTKDLNGNVTATGNEVSVTIAAKSATAASEKSFTPPYISTIYEIAIVGGGGAAGYTSGGGGGEVKTWSSATLNNSTVSWTIGLGGSTNFSTNTNDGTRGGSGGTTTMTGTTTTMSASGGQGGQSSYPSTGTRSNDGGGAGVGYGPGSGVYDMSGKSVIAAGGGGGGNGGPGGNGTKSGSTYTGGGAGAGSSAYALGTGIGAGGAGYGTNGMGSGSVAGAGGISSTYYGHGGEGTDPNNYVYPAGTPGVDGAISFKYYAIS